MRRGLVIAAAAIVTVAAVFALVLFLNSRDDATIGEDRNAPGRAAPELVGAELERGNVVLRFSGPADAAALRDLAQQFGPESLAEAGQAVLVRRAEGTSGVVAEAYKRRLQASGPDDPQLREFVEYWLGRGAMR